MQKPSLPNLVGCQHCPSEGRIPRRNFSLSPLDWSEPGSGALRLSIHSTGARARLRPKLVAGATPLMLSMTRLFYLLGVSLCLACQPAMAAPPTCTGAAIAQTADDAYFIGSSGFASTSGEAEAGSYFRWLTNGVAVTSGQVAEDLLLHFDNSALGANGEIPASAVNLAYAGGKWGGSLALSAPGGLKFACTNNLHWDQRTSGWHQRELHLAGSYSVLLQRAKRGLPPDCPEQKQPYSVCRRHGGRPMGKRLWLAW